MKHFLLFLKEQGFESFFGPFLVLFFGWYTLALLGFFHPLFVWSIALASGLFLFLSIFAWSQKISPYFYILLFFAFFVGIFALQWHPTELLAGRDQGSLAEAAIRLSQGGSIFFDEPAARPFFEIYGPGTALNFPGFAYTQSGELTPQFPLGYIVWLGGFFTLFGSFGILFANLLLFVLSVTLFSYLVRSLGSTLSAVLGTTLFTLNFLPLWFISFTLSENLALTLFLLTTVSLLQYCKNSTNAALIFTLGSALALAFTRIEGWAVLCLCLLFFTVHNGPKGLLKRLWNSPILILVFFGSALAAATALMNLPYFKTIAKALIKIFEKDILQGTVVTESPAFLQVLFSFGLLPYFTAGTLAALYLLITKRYLALVPLFLCLPVLPYLLLPSITFDVPWMLRRFLFALYPTFLLLTWLCIHFLTLHTDKWKRVLVHVVFFLFFSILSFPAFMFFWNTHYQESLFAQTQKLATYFSSEDLLLVDKDITGSGFMIPTFPLNTLLDRNAVYFFNPEDFYTINRKNFTNTYLLIPESKKEFYEHAFGGTLVTEHSLRFSNDHIFINTDAKNPFKAAIPTSIPILILRIP
jgi:hypothetical protein